MLPGDGAPGISAGRLRCYRLGPKGRIVRIGEHHIAEYLACRETGAFRIGNYFLGKRGNSEQWCACWYSARARQTIRRSLGTKDFLTAQIELARFVARHADIRNADPASLTVAQVLERYWHHHAKDLPSADQARIAGRILVEHFERCCGGRAYPGKTTAVHRRDAGGRPIGRIHLAAC